MPHRFFALVVVLAVARQPVIADETPTREDIVRSIQRGLAQVEAAARRYPEHRDCFSCHHQTLPLLAMKSVREAELPIDEPLFEQIWKAVETDFTERLDTFRKGGRVGGDSATVAYGLWTAQLATDVPKEIPQALGMYLLKKHREDGLWKPQSDRPPLEGTSASTTILAIDGLQQIAAQLPQDDVDSSIVKAVESLNRLEPVDQQERAFLYWGYSNVIVTDGAADNRAAKLLAEIRTQQQPDGGWAQMETMSSDAYATGQTIFWLLESGMQPDDPAIQKGIQFLLKTQQEDGSWHVVTRSRPVQPWFDNGDPHGKDQFISTSATCWAVSALARSISRQ